MTTASTLRPTRDLSGGDRKRASVLLQITDTHLFASADTTHRGINTQASLDTVLAHARTDSRWPPDAIVVTGDIVHDESNAGYLRFRKTLESLGPPAFCIPGNHDDPAILAECLAAPGLQVCGGAALTGWRLILLNTFLPGEVGGELGPNELARLEGALSTYPHEYALICMHHHPLPMESAWLDEVGLRDAAAFLEIVARHEQVRAVLWGHVHQASDRLRDGVRFLSCPSTCSQFRPDSNEFGVDSRPPGMRWLALSPDGGLTTEVVRVSGAVPVRRGTFPAGG